MRHTVVVTFINASLVNNARRVAGMVIYLGYGVWHSSERRSEDTQVILYDVADKDSMIIDGVYR